MSVILGLEKTTIFQRNKFINEKNYYYNRELKQGDCLQLDKSWDVLNYIISGDKYGSSTFISPLFSNNSFEFEVGILVCYFLTGKVMDLANYLQTLDDSWFKEKFTK